MIACAPNWGATIDRAYQANRANGANLLTITGGHTIDALCYCLGEFRELAAFVVSQRERISVEETGEMIAKTSRASMQRQELALKGARGASAALADLPIPGKYRWVPEAVPSDSPYNVAQLYARFAESIRNGGSAYPGFDAAVTRHRLD